MLFLAELDIEVEGIDFSPASRALAPAEIRDRILIGAVDEQHVPERSFDLVICREVLEHLTVLQVRRTIEQLCRASARFVYATTRFHPDPAGLLDVTTDLETDPTHISLLTKDLVRCLFVLEGFRRRADLERRLDWGGRTACSRTSAHPGRERARLRAKDRRRAGAPARRPARGRRPRDRRPLAGGDRTRAPSLGPVPALGGRAVRRRPRAVDGRLARRRPRVVRGHRRLVRGHLLRGRGRRVPEDERAPLEGARRDEAEPLHVLGPGDAREDDRVGRPRPGAAPRLHVSLPATLRERRPLARPRPRPSALPPSRAAAAAPGAAEDPPGRLRGGRLLLPLVVRRDPRAPCARPGNRRGARRGDAGRPARHRDRGRRACRGDRRALRPRADAAGRSLADREPRAADGRRRPGAGLGRHLRRADVHRPTFGVPCLSFAADRGELLPSYDDVLRRLAHANGTTYTMLETADLALLAALAPAVAA